LVAKEHPVPQPGPHEVLDLKKSMEFFTKLGYMFNKQFTDETAANGLLNDSKNSEGICGR
jgi:hypothetical protein